MTSLRLSRSRCRRWAAPLGLLFVAVSATSLGLAEESRLVPKLKDLDPPVQAAIGPKVRGKQILEIEEAKAHGVVEVAVTYLAKGQLHYVVWDATKQKLLGGSEPQVVAEVLRGLPEGGQKALQAQAQRGQLRRVKIKHAEEDDREYIHAHWVDASGKLSDLKLELDGRLLVKR